MGRLCGATKAITFMWRKVKICQLQTSTVSMWNRKVKTVSQQSSPQQVEVEETLTFSGAPLSRLWKGSTNFTESKWRSTEMKGQMQEKNVSACTYVELCQIYYFLRETNVTHWMTGWTKCRRTGHRVWSQHTLFHHTETLVEVFQL